MSRKPADLAGTNLASEQAKETSSTSVYDHRPEARAPKRPSSSMMRMRTCEKKKIHRKKIPASSCACCRFYFILFLIHHGPNNDITNKSENQTEIKKKKPTQLYITSYFRLFLARRRQIIERD
jgi:hypothetical protein